MSHVVFNPHDFESTRQTRSPQPPRWDRLATRLLTRTLGSFFRSGNLTLITAQGETFKFGDGSGPPVAVRFKSAAAQLGVLLDPDLKTGEAYMNGDLVLEEGSIADLLSLAFAQDHPASNGYWARLPWLARYVARRVQQFNPRRRSQRNVAHHYDLDGNLYATFLDADRQYSCAYFESPDLGLDAAQLAKKRHLAAKLLLEPGQRVLDIGSGWGGLGCYLAGAGGVAVDGVTLSREQLQYAQVRATGEGLSDDVKFHLRDYRDIAGSYDRIVSVGMFEHVGVGHYREFFAKCAQLLSDDGVFVLHSIGRSDGPGITSPWIAKYIFPGGYIPALSEVLPAIERAGLLVTDIEILRLHYAETTKAWRERFLARSEEVRELYDERFCRMWEFYLAASEMSFRQSGLMVFQIQLTKRQGVVPITRDYIARREAQLRDIENPARTQGQGTSFG